MGGDGPARLYIAYVNDVRPEKQIRLRQADRSARSTRVS